MRRFFTSESVTEGHPDKVCDQISDAVLDAVLSHDPASRAAIECCATTGMVLVMGELSTDCYVDISKIVRDTVKEIGYTQGQGFSYNSLAVITAIHGQSADIAMGVDASVESRAGGDAFDRIGAGDQGMMFGYAVNETEELMPLTAVLAHKLARRLAQVRKSGLLPYLRPDGKTQVTVEYEGKKPVRVDTVVVSAQHDEFVSQEQLHADIRKYVIDEIIDPALLDGDTKYYINPTGRFEIGGPEGDSGLTGRKIIVDTYGGRCAHGGGAFSGRTRPKWTAARRTWRATSARTSSRRGSPRVRDAARLRDRRRAARLAVHRHLRHRPRAGRDARAHRARELRPAPAGDHRKARPAPPRVPRDGGLRPLRPPAVPVERTDMAETLRKYL